MNKLLQHIINAGDVSHKYLPFLQKGGTLPDIKYIPRATGDLTGPSVDTTMAANIKAAQERDRQAQVREKQGEIRQAKPRRSVLSKALAVAANPFTAASYTVKGQDIPDNFERGLIEGYDMVGSLVNPFSAIDAVRKTPESIQQGDYLGAALNIADILPGVVTVPKTARSIVNQADRFSPIGRKLEAIRMEGKAAGLSDYDIARRQFDQVGITSNQRQGYVPGASELARKYIIPYGYSDKLKQVASNIKRGGVDYTDPSVVSPARADAWNLYLGFPQRKRTFRMAETAPVNHSAYSSKQLRDMDLYSLNQEDLIAEEIGRGAESVTTFGVDNAIYNLKDKSFVDVDPVDVMGNFNARFTKEGLQYNDIWDLNPSYDLVNFLPQKLRSKVDESPLFYKKVQTPGTTTPLFTPRKIEVDVSKYFGKPFMSHGTVDLQGEDYRMRLLENLQNRYKFYTRNDEMKRIYAPKLDKLSRQIAEVEAIDRFKKEGGDIVDFRGQSTPIASSAMAHQQNVYVDKSNIQGKGLFAADKIKKGSLIGLAHANGQPVGKIGNFHNHSTKPNAISIPFGNKRFLVAAQDLPAGKEITTDYRMQPELEQPSFNWKMKNGGQHGGLDRWFAEKWVDIKSGKPCGRQEGEDRSYPACRPSRRVSSQTPKTSSEMSPAEKAKFKRTKTSSERIPYNHKRK